MTTNWKQEKAWREAARRKFIQKARRLTNEQNQNEMAAVIAQCVEQFGKKPSLDQLAQIFGVSKGTISEWKGKLKKRLRTSQCPICGGSGITAKL